MRVSIEKRRGLKPYQRGFDEWGRGKGMKMKDFMGEGKEKMRLVLGEGERGEMVLAAVFLYVMTAEILSLKRGKAVTIIQRIGYYQKTLSISNFSNEIVS